MLNEVRTSSQAMGIASLSTTTVFAGFAPAAIAFSIARFSTCFCTAWMLPPEVSSNVSITPEICAQAAPTALAAS